MKRDPNVPVDDPKAPLHMQPHTEPLDELPPPMLSRREFVRNTVRLAVAGTLIPGVMSQLIPAVAPDAFGGSGAAPVILRDPTTNAKIPVTVDMVDSEGSGVLTAEWNFLPAVVYKVDVTILEGSAAKRGYNTAQFAFPHPTDSTKALLVYEGKCKHLGCTVGWDESLGGSKDIADYNENGVNDGRILCPCHQGQYDIYDLARNVPGTPPPAPLNVVRANIGDYSDPATGVTSTNVIMGYEKIVQNAYRDADRDGDGTAFNLAAQATTE